MDIKQADKYSIYNREQIELSDLAGCYHCLSIYSPQEISEYCDDGLTIICPKCGVDSVLGSKSGYSINSETLKKLNQYWF